MRDQQRQSVTSHSSKLGPRKADLGSWKRKGEQLRLSRLLGQGSFSDVHALSNHSEQGEASLTVRAASSATLNLDDDFDAGLVAIKRLKANVRERAVRASAGHSAVEDFLYEAEILSRLQKHENVINILAVSDGFWEDPKNGYLVLERVHDTLEQKIRGWAMLEKAKRPRAHPFGLLPSCSAKAMSLQERQRKRIQMSALGIAEGMKFLHSQKIVYRDLKPSNCAFALDGTVKILDFGLSRPHFDDGDDACRRLTGLVGTLRYMAPEVAASQKYSFAADVYSFAILLWNICTLDMPFKHLDSIKQWYKHVVESGKRPPNKRRLIASPQISELLLRCWSGNASDRPPFEKVCLELKQEVNSF